MAVAAIAANLSQPAIREPRDHSGFADPRSISAFEAVVAAAALPLDKARSNRHDERRSATTRLSAQPPGIFCGLLLNSVVGDMALTCSAQGDVQPQSCDRLLNSATLHLDKQPMRAPLERIPMRLAEHASLGGAGAAHGYPD
jgi:glucokinase